MFYERDRFIIEAIRPTRSISDEDNRVIRDKRAPNLLDTFNYQVGWITRPKVLTVML